MIAHNEQNCDKIAAMIVDAMDLDDCLIMVKEIIANNLQENAEEFADACNDFEIESEQDLDNN